MEITKLSQISEQTTSFIYQWTFSQAESIGLHNQYAHILSTTLLLIAAFIILAILDWIIRLLFNTVVLRLINKTKTRWDNYLLDNRVHVHLGRVILILISKQFLPFIFIGFPSFISVLTTILSILIILAIYSLVNGLLKTARDIARSMKGFEDKPVDSYLQVFQIFLLFFVATLVISQITGSSPWSFLVSLGAASAVLMLVFKDTILGFVASIQVSANDSVRVGDWIEMPKYGVDGDILQINLNNVRVRNWDKTIVTIPTYTLLSDSFKNYRGMQETGGRRIKRPINIKISTIRYFNEQEIENLKKISLLAPFIEERENEIMEYN
ncbi:MAG: mechanosensitive ion channel family protein, partial [Sphingobacterium sp.]